MNGSPPVIADASLPSAETTRKSGRHFLAVLLSLCLMLFLLDAVFSVADDFLNLLVHSHLFSFPRGLISIMTVPMALGIYALMGLTPMVPKRLLLAIPGFYLGAMLVMFPLAIFWYPQMQLFALLISLCQVVVAFGLILLASRGEGFSWPLVPMERLGGRAFSWRNLSVFALVSALVVLPLTVIYIFVCAAGAVGHFSEGFMALRPGGFTVQVRKYVRDDGKVIELFPMAHVANADFYLQVSQTFPSNSMVLMEGVSDSENLLTNKITYKRMAKSLGLSEQKETFSPGAGEVVRADVDVKQFSSVTIDFLNLVMLIHSRGMNAETLSKLLQFTPPPDFERQLFDDILIKRNEHLFGEIQSHLAESDDIMVPWGVAHMPGIARELQKAGFRLSETHEYVVIRFHGARNRDKEIAR